MADSLTENRLSADLVTKLAGGLEKHPHIETALSYGTAGFRGRADKLDSIVFKMGILSALRSASLHNSVIGVMITASHNSVLDNGVKLIDPAGEMLSPAWEHYATNLSQAANSTQLIAAIETILIHENINMNNNGRVFVARDTRQSGITLTQALIDGITSINGTVNDLQVLTTPQLHYIVRYSNYSNSSVSIDDYYARLVTAYKSLIGLNSTTNDKPMPMSVDCANGVGAIHMKLLEQQLLDTCIYTIHNDGSMGELNLNCGAEHVKSLQTYPEGLTPGDTHTQCCSLDGDADRIVFFYKREETSAKQFCLLDGDKMSSLMAGFIKEHLIKSELDDDLSFVVVQTAYANGSSTQYLQDQLKLNVVCTSTGVKYLHKKALEYDIGVYFEANGHGTILFSQKSINKFEEGIKNYSNPLNSVKARSLHILYYMSRLLNQAIGDSLSDLLAIQVVLVHRNWTFHDWNNCYTDLPNRLLKIRVKDRTVVMTTDSERRCTAPVGLQEAIDAMVKLYPNGRAFVRPSGTEDVVRLYAEADTVEHMEQLAHDVCNIVKQLAGGIND